MVLIHAIIVVCSMELWAGQMTSRDYINIRAVVRYDGTPFHGWQVQPDRRTVQGDLMDALSRIANCPIQVHGTSRTDAGVHALGQVCSFQWPADRPWDHLERSLSQMLGPEIRVDNLEPAPEGFHARHSARGKRYAYTLSLDRRQDPFAARYAWTLPWKLDMSRLADLAQRLVGTHDFAGFQSAGSPAATTERTLHSITVHRGGVIGPVDSEFLWRIEYEGDAFLYRMVRNLTGTLVNVARGYLPETWLGERLAAPGPFKGLTAPGHGLVLLRVYYES